MILAAAATATPGDLKQDVSQSGASCKMIKKTGKQKGKSAEHSYISLFLAFFFITESLDCFRPLKKIFKMGRKIICLWLNRSQSMKYAAVTSEL